MSSSEQNYFLRYAMRYPVVYLGFPYEPDSYTSKLQKIGKYGSQIQFKSRNKKL